MTVRIETQTRPVDPIAEELKSRLIRSRSQAPQLLAKPDTMCSYDDEEKNSLEKEGKPSAKVQQHILGHYPLLNPPSPTEIAEHDVERDTILALAESRTLNADTFRCTTQEIAIRHKAKKADHEETKKAFDKIAQHESIQTTASIVQKITGIGMVIFGTIALAASVVTGGASSGLGVASILAGTATATAKATQSISEIEMQKLQGQTREKGEMRTLANKDISLLMDENLKAMQEAQKLWRLSLQLHKNRSETRFF